MGMEVSQMAYCPCCLREVDNIIYIERDGWPKNPFDPARVARCKDCLTHTDESKCELRQGDKGHKCAVQNAVSS